ncbi:MAG: ExeM/NucH family extracellular endonuclease, partial [Anaerolineae bacterium]
MDISGWILSDGYGVRHTFPGGTIVPDSCAIVVFGGGTPTGLFGGSLVQTASTGALGLNNGGDTVTLSDGVNVQGTQGYGSEGGDNQSLTLDPDITGTPPLVKHSTASLSGGALFSPGTLMDGSMFSAGCNPPVESKIHDIQGDGLASPMVGLNVTIEGVVVGDFQDIGQFGGFHVQEEDVDADSNPATSEGVFVYNYSTPVSVGDVVRVTGTVAEYNGLTELTNVSDVTIVGSGASVTAASVSLPVTSIEDLEAYEGMLVTFPQDLYITEFFNFDRYGEIVLSSERQFQPTAVFEPGSPEAADLAADNLLGRITLDDGRSDQNPDPARHPDGAEFTLDNTFRGGDIVRNLTGVMDYAFGSYKIQPTTGADYIPQNPRTAQPDDVAGTMKVASFNVLNYFSTIDTGAFICGPAEDQECRGADTPEEFQRQRDKIFAALADIDADVVGLIEIENNVTDAAVQDLVAGLNESLGSEVYGYIATGPIGTDAIKQAFIYKLDTVSPVGSYAILDDLSFVDPLNYGEWKNRPALAQTFEQNATGGEVTVVINHLKSKGSACGEGDDDAEQGNCTLTRTLAAQALVDWLATNPTGSGDADYLIMGDLNSYDKEDPIDAIVAGADDNPGTGDDYTDLAYQFLGEYAYSYVFDGQLGYLDYALANQDLSSQVTGVTIWHINSDEPDILDYDMTYKQDAQDALYEPNAYRSSDHDPVIVGLRLEGDNLYLSSNSDGMGGDVVYADEDIVRYNLGSGEWSMLFDGSDVGVKGTDVDALHVMDDGSILMSFEQKIKIPGFGKVRPQDIVRFIPTSLGDDTAGTFEMYFDGSDYGLKKYGEGVDAIAFTPDGRLVVSTLAALKVPRTGGGHLRGADDDLIALNPSGDWEMYLDGSDVWSYTEDVWGTWIDAATGDIYLSMQNDFTAGAVSGDELDVFVCHPDSLGVDSACTFSPYFDGSAMGFGGDVIDGFAIAP